MSLSLGAFGRVCNFMIGVLSKLDERVHLRLFLPVAVAVALVLLGLKLFVRLPSTLIIVLGLSFVAYSALFWTVTLVVRRDAPPARRARPVGLLVSSWILLMAAFLSALYLIDRAGWLWFNVTGLDMVMAEEFEEAIDLSVTEFVDRHPAFAIDPGEPDSLVLSGGVHDFDRTVVIPRQTMLTIEPGTTMRFGVGRSLISYSPIVARGTPDDPILFTASHGWFKWGVVAVVSAGPSIFEYVRFEDGREARVNGIDFFGALSVIQGDVEIRDSQFVNLFGKDGVNVREGQVHIQDNLFHEIYRDGLDLDDSRGLIRDNQFINCGDEGIDLGGDFDVDVRENVVLDSRGGRIGADRNLDEIISQNTLGYSD